MDVMAKERPDYETADDWISAIKKKFEPPQVSLRNYGGECLDLLAQLPVCISQKGYRAKVNVLVQKGAPNNLLLGTDVHQALGFCLVKKETESLGLDLTTGKRMKFTAYTVTTPTQADNTTKKPRIEHKQPGEGATKKKREIVDGVVRLLNATRIPPGHEKIVQAKLASPQKSDVSLFTPQEMEEGVQIADAAVDMSQGTCIPIRLKKGAILGSLEPAELVLESEERGTMTTTEDHEDHVAEDSPANVAAIVMDKARISKLTELLPLQVDHLAGEEKKKLLQSLEDNSDVFALDSSELGNTTEVTHSIDTGSSKPVRQGPRRTPFALREKVNQMVDDMLKQGVIQESKSPWASPIVLVKKKDGDLRFCIDYRKLNHITKKDVFPLPRIDDTLDLLAGTKYFTTLDLASGYWQVEMEPGAREKTAFVTWSGLYEFRKMPFGLVNAPATFQRLMEMVLAIQIKNGSCLVYIDDVIVLGRTLEDHLIKLKEVLAQLRKAGLRLKPKKCQFAQLEVTYLGHVVSAQGIRTDPKKLEAVQKFPVPAEVKSLRSFLGLASYYRKFIPIFSKIAGPLHALTKKDVEYVWSPQCQELSL